MKFSESWLREWVSPKVDTDTLVSQLTMAGLEVDAVEPAAGDFCGVLVAEILSVEPHPDAEKLRVCLVSGHPEGEKQIVCGAPNARVGIKVPFATIGAKLPGDFKIKKAKLRGVESFGMLCGQTELEAGDDDSGLWELAQDAPVGEDIRDYLNLNDSILELDLTPNRGDCLSIRGLAREVGVLNENLVTEPVVDRVEASCGDRFSVSLSAPTACSSYSGRVLKGVDVSVATPLWMVEKLRRSGVRSIDPIVDVTNYVLLELGQPMHAFDLAKLSGEIDVRFAADGEMLSLLNEQKIELKSDSLVIADGSGPIALAGIMGGESTAVSTTTKDIFLEAAFFNPVSVAGKARAYGLHTDSSHRFERGVDYELQTQAIERATQLLLGIVGGEAGPVVEVIDSDHKPRQRLVRLNKARLVSGLSLDLTKLNVPDILSRLGLSVESSDDAGWMLSVPSYRFDISIEEDLLEEVARIYGYDNLPTRALHFSSVLESHPETRTPVSELKAAVVARGYQEVITYSFIDPKLHELLYSGVDAIELKNPISAEMSCMRTSLIPGLVQALQHNLKRQHLRAKLFEAGMVFLPGQSGIQSSLQKTKVAGIVSGAAFATNWSSSARDADFFDVKGDLEGLLAETAYGKSCQFGILRDIDGGLLHPGQAASVFLEDQVVGYLGALHPSVQKALGFNKPVFVFECDLSLVCDAKLPAFSPLSKHPEVSRDLAVVVDKLCCVSDIDGAIRKTAGNVLKQLKLFDVYSGEGVDNERKSLAFSLTFQHPSQTLKDDEVNVFMSSIVSCLEKDFKASLR